MTSNIVEFLKTRKFWSPIIALISTAIAHYLPQIGIDIPPDMLNMITLFLWSIAGIVVYGDAKYDWINAENAPVAVPQSERRVTDEVLAQSVLTDKG